MHNIIGIDPGVRYCGWCVYIDEKATLGVIKTTRSKTGKFRGICDIIVFVVDELLQICKNNQIKTALIEQQGARVHYSVQIFIGILFAKLADAGIDIIFITPRSFANKNNTNKMPSKTERAEQVMAKFNIETAQSLHATDAGFLILHHIGESK